MTGKSLKEDGIQMFNQKFLLLLNIVFRSELSGLTAEEATGFGWLKAVHPDDREKLERGWNSDVQSKISSVAEYRFVRRDGSIVWVIGNDVPELIDNEVVDYIGTITDITYRKQAEDR